jgi:hypothetical protein
MKIKYNKILPFKPYLAIMLFGTIYTRSKEPLSPQVINHEEIHEAQAKDNIFGYVGYYLHYIA